MAISLKPVVLGLLVERPGYGYDLATRIKARRLPWGTPGVYEAIDALAAEGHVVAEQAEPTSPRRPGRTVYAATSLGRRSHHDWLLQSCDYQRPRQELDIKLTFCGPAQAPHMLDQIAAQEQLCLAELRDLKGDAVASASPRVTWAEAGPMLMRSSQIKQLEARVEYLQEARALLRGLLERTPRPA